MKSKLETKLVQAAKTLADAADHFKFRAPITHAYNPLQYAWKVHEAFLRKFGGPPKRTVFLGMNPGPFGMVQTGIPFGEVTAVRDWMGLEQPVGQPARPHPQRPVTGFACHRSEVSGRRLWGLFAERFGRAEEFFADHFVVNYCPLAFFDASGRNLTPDKLASANAAKLLAACDAHLGRVVDILSPKFVIGIGTFAAQRARQVLPDGDAVIGQILHPSPASPAANRDWAGTVTCQLQDSGVW